MENFIHKVCYYETDKMGITHHSNYIHWMEEARVYFLDKIGYGYSKLEKNGVNSPVIGISCEYKSPTTFEDQVEIEVKIKQYNGVKLIVEYIMTNLTNKKIALIGSSTHCFLNSSGKPIRLKNVLPELDNIFNNMLQA